MPYGAAHPPEWSNSIPGEYYYLGGTSMATPHVAGIIALMMDKDPSLNSLFIENCLETTALPIPAPYTVYVVDPFEGTFVPMTWNTDATGCGMVQADAALLAIP